MSKRIIKLTESQLKNIVDKVINEQGFKPVSPKAPDAKAPMADLNSIPGATFKKVTSTAMNPKGGVNQFSGQKSLNINCIGFKSPETNKVITGINGEMVRFYNNGRFIGVKGKGNYVCGNQANIVNLMYDSNPKEISYFNMSPKPLSKPVSCAPQLVDTSKGKTLSLGCKTQGVKELQNILGMNPTGYFGPVTDKMLKKWQSEHQLKSDGIVGPKTYNALINDIKSIKPNTNNTDQSVAYQNPGGVGGETEFLK